MTRDLRAVVTSWRNGLRDSEGPWPRTTIPLWLSISQGLSTADRKRALCRPRPLDPRLRQQGRTCPPESRFVFYMCGIAVAGFRWTTTLREHKDAHKDAMLAGFRTWR